ncbi:MAG TPA: type II secretion system minor pseudopilin GspK [Pseudomonadales bacterium]|nr:type II secretion system minor pseudopilin GspK [Pseudomonadales bacterium]
MSRPCLRLPRFPQRGIAVITVLLALAIAILISSEVIMRVYMGVKRTENQLDADQAWQYALGGEALGRQLLAMDYEKNKQLAVDHLYEDWAIPAQTIPVEGGFIEVEIYDLQSRFNLNNLVDDNGQVVPDQLETFTLMLSRLGVNPAYGMLAAHWASYPNDNESLYGNKDWPYRAGDTQFGSVSELRLLRDMDMGDYLKIAPYVSALPVSGVPININTAPEPVLAGLVKSEPGDRLRAFIQQREQLVDGIQSTGTFINQVIGNGVGIDKNALSVASDYFEIRVRSSYNGRRAYLVASVYRDPDNGEISLLGRDSSQRFIFLRSAENTAKKADDKKTEGDDDGKQDKKRKKSDKKHASDKQKA